MMLVFTLMGSCAGYVSSRLYKLCGGDDWRTTTLLTATLYPGIFFGMFFFLNLWIWGEKSSGAVPFTTMFVILVLWFGISLPLVFLGAYFGFRKDVIEVPCRTNPIPRDIPLQPWVAGPVVSSLLGGVLPFGASFTEMFFIMSSIWQHRFYYLFSFLGIMLSIIIVMCAEISIAFTYFQLTTENYAWWWRSFFASASSGLYVFLYAQIYYLTRLSINKFVPSL